jgi:hypothetical protein
MWYREILAYREVTDPKGERTFHRTKNDYERPTFVMDENYKSTYQEHGLGNGYITQGPGYYTTQNPAELHHYGNLFPTTREVRIPKGARILDYENPTEEDMRSIIDAWNKKYNTNYQYDSSISSFDDLMYVISNSNDSREVFKGRYRIFKNDIPNNTINRLYPLLIEMGFDAIDYIDLSGRRGETSDYEKFQETSGMSSRTKDKKNKLIDKKNILIINRAMITMPDLFQKARLRPETLTEEEKIKLKDEQQTTAIEYSKALIDSDADIRPKLQEIIDALDGGVDPQKVLNYIKKVEFGFHSLEDKLNFLLKIKKYYNENIIFTIFTNQEITENKQKIRSYIGDYGKGKAVGFASNYMEATEKLLRKFSQKYLIDGQANPSLSLEQTIFALEEYGKIQKLLEMSQKDFGRYSYYKNLLSNHFIRLISQINSFDFIFQLVNDMELRANLTKDAIIAMINKQEELRNQTAKVAYKVRIRYVV